MGNPEAAAAGAPAGNFEFGVDPSLDPELALVRLLEMCMKACN